jgi:hypothetical protein
MAAAAAAEIGRDASPRAVDTCRAAARQSPA